MNVFLHLFGDIEIDNAIDGGDVQASGRHIGSHQEIRPSLPETLHHSVALILAHSPMDSLDIVPQPLQLPHQPVHPDLHPGEYQGLALRSRLPQHLYHSLQLIPLCHLVVELPGLRHHLDLLTYAHPDRVLEVVIDEPSDKGRYSGRKERRLSLPGGPSENLHHVLGEADIQHLVSLVQDGYPHTGEVHGLPAKVIDDPARGAHYNVSTLIQGLELFDDGFAAVDGHHPGPAVSGKPRYLSCDL